MEPITWAEMMPTDDGLFLLALIDRADTCIPCGWMSEDEQHRLDAIRQRIAAGE